MKKPSLKILFLLFILNATTGHSQPSLSGSIRNTPGFKEFATLYSTATGLSEGVSGANVTWNFATYPVYKSELFECITPSTAPSGAMFPSAFVADNAPLSAGDTLFSFTTDSSGMGYYYETIIGSYENYRHTLLSYSIPKKIVDFPAVKIFNDSTSNNYAASGTLDSAGITGTISRYGTFIMKYDAYGTLTTNDGTITNVARLKMKDDFTDSIIITGTLTVNHKIIESYSWSASTDPGSKLAFIEHRNINGVLSDYGYSKCPFCSVNAINELQSSIENIKVFPQPSKGKTHIQFNSLESGDYLFTLSDINGKQFYTHQTHLSKGLNDFDLDNSTYPTGDYLLNISKNNSSKTIHLSINK